VIGIAERGITGTNYDEIPRFVAQTGVTFPIGTDASRSYRQFTTLDSLSPFPVDVIVGRDGTIAYHSQEFNLAAMVSAIERLLVAAR